MSELSITALVTSGGDVLQCGYASLKEQARALERLAGAIDERFVQAVRLLLSCQGHLAVVGQASAPLVATRLAAGLELAGFEAAVVSSTIEPQALAGSDLVLVISGEALTETESQAIVASATPVLLLGGQQNSVLCEYATVQLPVAIDIANCPPHLLPAVQELAILAQGDALVAAAAQQRRRAEACGAEKES